MAKKETVLTIKKLKSLIRLIKSEQKSVFSYAEGGNLYQSVMQKIGDSPQFLIDEIVNKAIKNVIDEDSKVDLSNRQPDFIGYSEKLIKLPEQQAVKVEFATIDHMRVQQQTVLENYMKQMRGYILHNDGILTPIIRTMEEKNLKTAGEAIAILSTPI